MIHMSLPEFGRIARSGIDPQLLQRLQRFDESHASTVREPVFDWSNSHFIRAVNYVGVVQVPGFELVFSEIDVGPIQGDDSLPRSLVEAIGLDLFGVLGHVKLLETELKTIDYRF